MFSGLGQVICEQCKSAMRRVHVVTDVGDGLHSVTFECAACLRQIAFEYGRKARDEQAA